MITAALAGGVGYAQAVDSHPIWVEVGGFFPQNDVKDTVGNSAFYVAALYDISKFGENSITSVGASWVDKKDGGNEARAIGLFARQTWYMEMKPGAKYTGFFGGFDVGFFQSHIKTALLGGGGNNGGGGFAPPPPGTDENKTGVGGAVFVGYRFDNFTLRGAYNFYPKVAGATFAGFSATLGYRF